MIETNKPRPKNTQIVTLQDKKKNATKSLLHRIIVSWWEILWWWEKLSGLQYRLCVVCPYCHQGRDKGIQECSNHGRVSCDDEKCFHLLEVKLPQPLICTEKFCNEVRTVHGLTNGSWRKQARYVIYMIYSILNGKISQDVRPSLFHLRMERVLSILEYTGSSA